MARKKLKLAYITDDNLRKQSFKHRKKGLMKKLDEIKILCGVDACAIIYDQSNPNPEVWPSKSEVNNIIERFEKLTSKDHTNRSVSQQEFLNQYIAKVERKNKKMSEENHEGCMREVMFKCLDGKMNDFHMGDDERIDLCKFIDQYLKELLHHKMVTLNNPHFEIGESSSMAANMSPIPVPPFMAPTTMCEANSSFISPQLTNELQCIVSSNQGLEQVNSLATNLLSNNNQEFFTPSMNQSIIPSYQGSEHFDFLDALPNNNQEVYTPVVDHDEYNYPNQKENHQKGIVEEMMEFAKQTGFPWMEDNDHNNHN